MHHIRERATIGRYQWIKAWAWITPGLHRVVIFQTGVVWRNFEK